MAFKFVVFAAFVAVAQAGHLGLGAVAYGAHGSISPASVYGAHGVVSPYSHAAPFAHAEPSAPAHYDFGYAVSDPHTGDHKQQQESRRGDVVQGSYSLLESDGTKRVVEYSADPHNGFNAVVHKEPTAHTVHAAPAYSQGYAAPALAHGYAAPSAYAHGYAAPAYAHGYAAPAYGHGYAAPAYAHGYAAPAVASTYGVSHGVAAPYAHQASVYGHGW